MDLKTAPTKGGAWVYAHRPNASDVVIILTKYKNEILFLLENRPPILAEKRGKYTVGMPAGLVGDERLGETIEDAIRAELLEEAGLIAEKIEIKSRKVASSAGCTSETFTVAIVDVLDKKPIQNPVDDNGVIVERIWIEQKEIFAWLTKMEKEGNVLTAQALSALFYLYE